MTQIFVQLICHLLTRENRRFSVQENSKEFSAHKNVVFVVS